MKKLVFLLKKSVSAIFVIATTSAIQAQQVTPQQPNQLTGKQLYKQAKKYDNRGKPKKSKESRILEDVQARNDFEFQRLKSPKTNNIPSGIREAELEFSSKIVVGDDSKQSMATAQKSSKATSYSYWKNRGPYNVGGRTRALAIDYTNENIILAGGVSGGLWRSSDSGATWTKVTRPFQDPSITAIVQDPRPNHSFTWYYASGERLGNSASAGGAFYGGSGVYKSQDGGRTWELLNASIDNTILSLGPLDVVNSLAIDPTNGDLYVGSSYGILRSQNGGNSFEELLPGGLDAKAEVAVTNTGQIYATISSQGDPNSGFYTSSDGDTWTEITPDGISDTFTRTVMDIDPSNEDVVYFFTNSLELFKYNAAATEEDPIWTDLSENLPTNIGGFVGDLSVQGGYNMVIKVSPADPNLMFVGGTNLYRSTTGFTTPTGYESWIGGYSPLNNVSIYPDQHPDQHALVFYPSNPNKVLSGSDGGVAVTEDITSSLSPFEPVDWTSLNNGYITTQPYHVSFDPEANSDDLVAGFQDNSTWYVDSTDPTAPWANLFGGDGSYSAIADGGKTRYVSSQIGNLYRLNYDESGELVSFTRVTPAGATSFLFIAPFILDHNIDNIMYMPSSNRIWRNNNLDEIPVFDNNGSVFPLAPTSINWVDLPNSDTPEGTLISALDVSTYPVANVLYYGSTAGHIYRMNNANLDNQEAVDISTGKGLPAGYVNDINVDPSNSDRVIVTFSNYEVISLFLTEDGGDTWTNISGNLEENADGSGNGPSVRSTAFFGGSQGVLGGSQKVYAATSTGLYYTTRLNGTNTVWRREDIVIGNAVTDEVVTRKDGFIALAAHGNGLYSAKFPIINEVPEPKLSVSYLLPDVAYNIYNAPPDLEVDVTDLFVHSDGGPIEIELTNSHPDIIDVVLEENTLQFTFKELNRAEKVIISLIATSGEETVAEGFTIDLFELSLFDQSQSFFTGVTPCVHYLSNDAYVLSADDFTIPEGDSWTIHRILTVGFSVNLPTEYDVNAVIYADDNGVPGKEIFNTGPIAPVELSSNTINVRLEEGLTLDSGTYWLSVYPNLDGIPTASVWYWMSETFVNGEQSYYRDDSNLYGYGFEGWTPGSDSWGFREKQLQFQMLGAMGGTADSKNLAEEQLLITSNPTNTVTVQPNPSSDRFLININKSDSDKEVLMQVFDVLGNPVYTKQHIKTNAAIEFDASGLKSGVYIVKFSGGMEMTTKLIKK